MLEATFAGRLKLLRILAGLSQEDLAEALGIPQSKIVYYETGKVKPRKNAVKQIAALFSCAEHWLTDGIPDAFRFSWSVLPPTRYSHLVRMVRDAESGIQTLLPIFCQEHNVQRAFTFTWENHRSVFALEYGRGKYPCFLIIKTQEPMTSVLMNVLLKQEIANRLISTERISEAVWKHLFNPESGQDENRNSLHILLQDIQQMIPDRLTNLTMELYITKNIERMNVLHKRPTWSFPCDITVSNTDGIERAYALQEVFDILSKNVSATGTKIKIKFRKMADNEILSESNKSTNEGP